MTAHVKTSFENWIIYFNDLMYKQKFLQIIYMLEIQTLTQ